MTVVKYRLISDFKGFQDGQIFRRVSRYGDGYIYDEKLELIDDKRLGSPPTLDVKKSDLNDNFSEIL